MNVYSPVIFSHIYVTLCSFLIILFQAGVRSALVRQFLDRYVPAYDHVVMRRFDLNFPSSNMEEERRFEKRNNAELVNHIIKNFGTLDRLGDVGK